MIIPTDATVLFTGDSITDCGRNREDGDSLGGGYASMVASRLQMMTGSDELKLVNRGISGNRVYDVENRLQADLLDIKPDVVSILIGINDTWRRYDSNMESSASDFAESYRRILKAVEEQLDAQVVLLEPFLLHVPEDKRAWREDLNPRIDVVRELACEFDAELIPLDGIFAEAATSSKPEFWLRDGVHPSAAGHALIAEEWLARAEIVEE